MSLKVHVGKVWSLACGFIELKGYGSQVVENMLLKGGTGNSLPTRLSLCFLTATRERVLLYNMIPM